MRRTRKGSDDDDDDDVTEGITNILYEHVTLLLVASRGVCWRAFVSTVKKLKVGIKLVSS